MLSEDVVLCHYGSKQELLQATLEDVYANAAPELLAATESADDHRGKLDAYLHASVLFAWSNQQRLASVDEISHHLRDAGGRLRYNHADSDGLFSVVEQMIIDGQQAGEFADVDARTAAVMIRSTIAALPSLFAAEPGLEAAVFSSRLRNLVGRMVIGGAAP